MVVIAFANLVEGPSLVELVENIGFEEAVVDKTLQVVVVFEEVVVDKRLFVGVGAE